MDEISELNNKNYYIFSYSASLVIHIIILLACFVLLKRGDEIYQGKAIVVQMMQGGNLISGADDQIKEQKTTGPVVNNELNNQTQPAQLNSPETKSVSNSGYSNFEGTGIDTSGLQQVYSEKTLNVKIKYPVGWTFVDQDNHNKLDGVTFWANNGIFNPPPYIFLEVKEKYLFNPSRFKFSTKLANSVAWYNDPEELEGQVSQVFYIRTETDEDYSIKLIMNGRDTFIAFQPIFFSMIKSFNFGKSLF